MTKKQFTVSGIALLLLIVAVGWWSSHKKTISDSKSIFKVEHPRTSSGIFSDELKHSRTSSSIPSGEWEKKQTGPSATIDYENPENWWKFPISFYGKVVDENNQPLADAEVVFIVNDESSEGTTEYHKKSDGEGLFALTGVKGKGTAVDVSKKGYYRTKSANSYFHYAGIEDTFFIPDPNNPVVFQLRKKGEAAELVHREKLFTFSIDGTKYCLDLLTGKKVVEPNAQSDFAVSFVRSNKIIDHKFDWEVVFESANGGFIESNEEFMLEAPETGYQQSLHFGYLASDPNWKRDMERKFFLQSRGGKFYARLEVLIKPKYNEEAAIYLTYYLNPDGSRNLEYDKSKEIEVKVK